VNCVKEEPPAPTYDVTTALLAFEGGELDEQGTVELFQHLVDSGLAWQLQGHYGRCAQALIDHGRVTRPAQKAHALPEASKLVHHDLAVNSIGPFVGVDYEAVIEFKLARRPSRRFHVFTYRAYNACGLVGHECNGVAVCDINKGQVLCDEIAKQSSGYFGASKQQAERVLRFVGTPWQEFRQFINSNPRARYSI
jgi:hypothetical protein